MNNVKKRKIILIVIALMAIFATSGLSFFLINCFIECKKIVFAEDECKPSVITYNNGEVLFQSEKENVKISSLSNHTVDAFISIEDKDFYSHSGYNLKRMIMAGINNLTSFSFNEGASTITQQYIKNKYLTSDKNLKRKVKEIILARRLESQLTKNEIMENYLNYIYYGNGCYGIDEASKFYFEKSPSELNLNESAILACIIKAPALYSPNENEEQCFKRKNLVLKEMFKDKKISKEEYDKAVNEKISVHNKNKNLSSKANKRNLINYIYKECEKILKINRDEIEKNCYTIKTTLNKNIQDILRLQIENQENYSLNSNGNKADGLGIVIENKTNKILAFYSNSEYNVYSAKRQPGSSIKPILVYAPALDNGIIYQCDKILDEPIKIKNYTPHNLGDVYHGNIGINDAIAKSLNIPAVKVLEKNGIINSKKFAEKIGIEFGKNDNNFAIALGGFTDGITLSSLTNAYTTFSDYGNYKDEYIIEEILNENGDVIYKNNIKKEKVFNEATGYLITDLLEYSVENGTSKKLSNLDFDVAGKTGTVCVKNSNLNTDCYSVAYTSDITIGVWLGNYSYKMDYMLEGNNNGGTFATKIADDFLLEFYKDEKPRDFNIPNDIIFKKIDEYEYEYNNLTFLSKNDSGMEYPFNKKYIPPFMPEININLTDKIKIEINDENSMDIICDFNIKNLNLELQNCHNNSIYFGELFKLGGATCYRFKNLTPNMFYKIIVNNTKTSGNYNYIIDNNIVFLTKK